MDGQLDHDPTDQRIDAEEPESIRCRACGVEISGADAVIAVGGPPVQLHVNPHGVAFQVIALARAANLVLRGGPVRADSWYPGYAWTIAWCAGCGEHLGWCFDRVDDVSPPRFFGLVVGRLQGV